ncbi:MAG: pantetheine-phosphate adenylyltransferase [Clostridia bacterium]|nr:pantetheine-phosphate adenylyltransferase [Clostridia bacterium]
MKKAVIPGSFDPATLGHRDIIERAAAIFDEVHAVVMVNAEKMNSGLFTPDERLCILESLTRDIPNVKCAVCTGLASDYTKANGVEFIVKGARNATDFDYEHSLYEIMKHFHRGIETVILPADPSLSYVSSTYARERIRYGCDLLDVADEETAALIKKLYSEKKK